MAVSKSKVNVLKSKFYSSPISSNNSYISKVSSNSFFIISIIVSLFTNPSIPGPPPIAAKASTIFF
jgi:hypothetical protein